MIELGRPALRRWVLGAANVIQTIPSLALFGFLIPVPVLGGIGATTAIVALTLYALLPILRNTFAGISGVDHSGVISFPNSHSGGIFPSFGSENHMLRNIRTARVA